MKIVNALAIAALALLPAMTVAQSSQEGNEGRLAINGECREGEVYRSEEDRCFCEDGTVYSEENDRCVAAGLIVGGASQTGAEGLAALGAIPGAAAAAGAAAVVAGVAVGIAAATSDDDPAPSTTTTTN